MNSDLFWAIYVVSVVAMVCIAYKIASLTPGEVKGIEPLIGASFFILSPGVNSICAIILGLSLVFSSEVLTSQQGNGYEGRSK